MATVGYCSNYGHCNTATAKNVVDLKSNRDHCPDCGLNLHPIADLEPLLVAAAAERGGANPVRPAAGEPAAAAASMPAAPAPAARSPRTEHFSDPAPATAAAEAEVASPPAEPTAARGPNRGLLIGGGIVAAAALVGAVVWTVLPARVAPAAVAFRVCGTEALGGRLGIDLVQGFLTAAGGTKLEVTPFEAGTQGAVGAELAGSPSRVAIDAGGSTAAYAAIAAGACQAALAGRPPTSAELAKIRARYADAPAAFARRVASDGIVVVVNPGNRVDRISLEAVRRAFTGGARNWGELGGAAAPIAVVAPGDGSDVAAAFGARVLNNARMSDAAARVGSLRAVSGAVAHDRNAIGVVTFSESSPAKAVALDAGSHGYVAPSVLSIGATYPLSVHVGLYTPAHGDNALADRFATYLGSNDARNAIGNAGLVPTAP